MWFWEIICRTTFGWIVTVYSEKAFDTEEEADDDLESFYPQIESIIFEFGANRIVSKQLIFKPGCNNGEWFAHRMIMLF